MMKWLQIDVDRGIYVTVLMVAGGVADLHRFAICQYLPISAMSCHCHRHGRSQSAGCGAAEQIRSLHRIHRLVDPEPQARDRVRGATVVLVGV